GEGRAGGSGQKRTCRKVRGSDRSVGGPAAGSTRTPRDSISSTLALRWSFTRRGSPASANRVPVAATRYGVTTTSLYPSSRYHSRTSSTEWRNVYLHAYMS